MPRRVIPSAHPDRWTIYGRRPGLLNGTISIHRAVHRENILSEAEGRKEAMKLLFQHPEAAFVLVHLEGNQDKNGKRHVIARWNNGRAWWE